MNEVYAGINRITGLKGLLLRQALNSAGQVSSALRFLIFEQGDQ